MRALHKLRVSLSQRLLDEARLHYRTGVALVGMLLLTVVVTLPFTLSSIWDEMTGSPEGEVRRLGPPAEGAPDVAHSRLHVALVVFDELQRLGTFRLSGQYVCPAPCHVHDRLLLFSIDADDHETEGLAYSTVVSMPSKHPTHWPHLSAAPPRPSSALSIRSVLSLARRHRGARI